MIVPGIPVPVELVTRPDQLGPGVVVWIKPCTFCGSAHRMMLINRIPWLGLGPVWGALPGTFRGCHAVHYGVSANPNVLADGLTYREVIDLTEPAGEEVTQPSQVST